MHLKDNKLKCDSSKLNEYNISNENVFVFYTPSSDINKTSTIYRHSASCRRLVVREWNRSTAVLRDRSLFIRAQTEAFLISVPPLALFSMHAMKTYHALSPFAHPHHRHNFFLPVYH